VTAKDTLHRLGGAVDNDLDSRSKAELLELAAVVDIEGRMNMTKAELVSEIKKASRTAR
jgi:hypothetical protein